jgi:excinuclease ABC subunit C
VFSLRIVAFAMSSNATPPIEGFDVQAFLKTLTQRPGVYKMVDDAGEVIYVGKAKNLKKRVSSYFLNKDATPKQQAMVARVAAIEVTVTHTEGEALLLESQLVKRYQPRYNITLRDDKSFPYIHVSTHQIFPRVSFYRGSRKKQGRFFGPYPSAGAVRESLKLLQKIFPVRQCQDSFFKNRSRPCLQYQIERCTAPCVDLISPEAYAEDVRDTLMFLEGDGKRLIDELVNRMEKASADLQFEKAARYRDQIASLRTILAKQAVSGEQGDLDIVACAIKGSLACVQMLFIRGGQQIGDRSFFPKMAEEHDAGSVLEAFIAQYYLNRQIPKEILVSHEIENLALLAEVLSTQAKHPVQISPRTRGERLKRVQLAQTNAENALQAKLANQQDLYGRFLSLGAELGFEEPPRRLECFDISHTQGEQTVASCVVFDRQGPVKSAYRRFNIEGIEPGDDYAALAQAVDRRYRRIKNGEYEAPDLLMIDGGKGQVRVVRDALIELGMTEINILGVAKGPDRKPGMEMLFPAGHHEPILLPAHSPALLLIQQIRDEAHRFAITGHRQRRAKVRKQSTLEAIDGLGPKRRQQLLRQFGGLREISRAGVDALCSVEGINRQLAQRIYETFHEQEG